MKIFFRTDASLQIGSGHVIRCLTLADELRRRGADIRFVCREHPGHLIGLIEGKGYPVVRLVLAEAEYTASSEDVAHATWLGVPWLHDAVDSIAAVDAKLPDWLIIDHYSLDHLWEKKLRPHVGRIMVIDDLADRPHDCDLLLDQNLYQDMERRYESLVSDNCIKLLGPKYALLRPEFAAARKDLRQRDGRLRRILVFFGGVDISNETERVLQLLTDFPDCHFEVDVVVGSGNPYQEQIQKICTTQDRRFHYHCQVSNMAELMSSADLAIGAGGSATWERCSLGLPSLVFALAENQRGIARSADKAGVLKYMGESSKVSLGEISQLLRVMCASEDLLRTMSEKAWNLVDGHGAVRVADKMEQL